MLCMLANENLDQTDDVCLGYEHVTLYSTWDRDSVGALRISPWRNEG